MKLRFALLLTTLALTHTTVFSQTTNQWVTTGDGVFMGNVYTQRIGYSDAKHFIICGERDGGAKNFVAISNDSGKTWKDVLYRGFTGTDSSVAGGWYQHQFQSVDRPEPNVLLVLERWGIGATGSHLPILLRSEDEGVTWDTITVSNPPSYWDDNYLSMYDAHYGVMYTAHKPQPNDSLWTALYRTTDGGASWAQIQTSFDPGYWLRSLQTVAPGCIVLRNDDGGWRSVDDGLTWTQFPIPAGTMSIRFESPTLGWAAGGIDMGMGDNERDAIYRTTDGGLTWTTMLEAVIEPAFGLTDIDFADDLNGIAVGRSSKFLRTTDGGASWVSDHEPYWFFDPAIYEVRYPAASTAVALAGYHILRYTGLKALLPPTPVVTATQALADYKIHWKPIDGATGYRIQMAKDWKTSTLKYDLFVAPHMILDSGVFPDTVVSVGSLLEFDRDYFVRVKSLNAGDESDWSQPIKFTTPDGSGSTQLAKPQPYFPPLGQGDIPTPVTFQWQSVPNAQRYDLIVSTDNAFPDSTTTRVTNLTVTYHTLALDKATIYNWYVVAHADSFPSSPDDWYFYFRTEEVVSTNNVPVAGNGSLSVFPNPVHGTATVVLDGSWNSAATTVSIYDVFGRKLIERSMESGSSSVSLNLSALPAGLYTVQAASGMAIQNTRITVLK